MFEVLYKKKLQNHRFICTNLQTCSQRVYWKTGHYKSVSLQ